MNKKTASIIFRAGSLSFDAALRVMASIDNQISGIRYVLSHKPYPRSIGWINVTDAEWWKGKDYEFAIDKFLPLIPPANTIQERMRYIIATNNTLESYVNYSRGFHYEYVLENRELIETTFCTTEHIVCKVT